METSEFSLVLDEFGVRYVGKKHGAPYYTNRLNINQYQWIGLGDYIVELVWIGIINKDMSPYICQDMWRVP